MNRKIKPNKERIGQMLESMNHKVRLTIIGNLMFILIFLNHHRIIIVIFTKNCSLEIIW